MSITLCRHDLVSNMFSFVDFPINYLVSKLHWLKISKYSIKSLMMCKLLNIFLFLFFLKNSGDTMN